ncbi:MAG: Calcineurin-like phosphoeSPTERase [Firmicutes bacterium]|nr:Calcineurin-like phosphoeSPTERase [Bacillota bacterium]
MKIFAISDTHLSGQPPLKPMTIFGAHWQNHWEKIKADWQTHVTPEDTVLLAGDISWAMKLKEVLSDLNEIADLPGKKLIIKGNHDYWWQTIGKMNAATDNRITFIQNNFAAIDQYAICGSRGWTCPADPYFSEADLPIYTRELTRVKASLNAAYSAGHRRFILLLHFPPQYGSLPSGFTQLMDEFQVEICVFGHLHDEAIKTAPSGNSTTAYHLVSCDALNFKLKQII